MAEENYGVSVRTVFGGRTARATTNKFDDESLRNVVKASEDLARVQEPDADLLPVPTNGNGEAGVPARSYKTSQHLPRPAANAVALRLGSGQAWAFVHTGILLILTVVFISFLPACSAKPAPDTLVMIIESSPTNLDPRVGLDAQSERIDALMFDNLLARDEHLSVKPGLAERWEIPDPKTYIFHLRKGVSFSDGRPLTARFTPPSAGAPSIRGWPRAGTLALRAGGGLAR